MVGSAPSLEHEVAGLQIRDRHVRKLVELGAGEVIHTDAGLPPRHHRESGAVERVRSRGCEHVRLADLGARVGDDRRHLTGRRDVREVPADGSRIDRAPGGSTARSRHGASPRRRRRGASNRREASGFLALALFLRHERGEFALHSAE